MTTSLSMFSMATLALLMFMYGLLDAAPLQGNPVAAEEMQLANLVKQTKSQVPELSADNLPQTKVLLQKTKIVIPIDDDEPAAPVEGSQVPEVAPVAQSDPRVEEPMRFVAPPQVPVEDFTQEENEFLFPSDYQLNSGEAQFQTYDYSEPEVNSPDLDLTPQAVAEYLVLTGDFQGFDEALNDLLDAGMLSLSQVEEYRLVVGQEYERLMGEMSLAEDAYEQQQYEQPTEAELREELYRDAEAGKILQTLLQDYMMTENMDANSQEYGDYLDWMEKSLNDKSDEPMQDEIESQLEEDQVLPATNVEQELESLPTEVEDESSGDVEEPEHLVATDSLSSTEKKLKKALEAASQ